MKKYWIIIMILCAMFLPSVVSAEDCEGIGMTQIQVAENGALIIDNIPRDSIVIEKKRGVVTIERIHHLELKKFFSSKEGKFSTIIVFDEFKKMEKSFIELSELGKQKNFKVQVRRSLKTFFPEVADSIRQAGQLMQRKIVYILLVQNI